MQQFGYSRIIREEVIRGLTFAISFFLFLSIGFVTIAYGANGGKFGEILNMILASGDWENDTTGIVKNSEKLGGLDANEYVKVNGGFECPTSNQCIYKIDSLGTPQCR